MQHAPGDGPGPDDRHLDHQVVPALGPQPRQHGHLGAALHLEHAHGVGPVQHGEGGAVLAGDAGQGEVGVAVGAQQVEGQVQLVERAQPQQIDLEQAEGLHIVLGPLDDGAALHAGVLDGHEVVHRLVAQQEAAWVDRQVARKLLDLVHQPGEVGVQRRLRIEAGAGEVGRLQLAVVAAQLGQPVQVHRRQPQRLAHLADRRARPEAHHVADHGRPVAPVFGVDVLDHFLAPVVLDVQVDVRRLGPFARDEALEQQVHLARVHRRDLQAVAHHRVGRRTAPLADDPLLAAEAHDLGHGQEVALVIQLVDQFEFAGDAAGHVRRDRRAEAVAGALAHQLVQPARLGHTEGQLLGRVAVAQGAQVEVAAVGDLFCGGEGCGVVGEELLHEDG